MPAFAASYTDRHITVMGLGTFGGGISAARFLALNGARVTVTDLRTEAELQDSIEQLADVPIAEWCLGDHPPRVFQECDLLVVNPAVKPDHPEIAAARTRGIDVTTEIDLFCRHNPAPLIAVTGSNGKSTTSALIHHLLTHSWQNPARKAWLGGNIGISLLEQLPKITADDRVVLELSSFQLELLRTRRFRPDIAVITNFSSNHLDWHGSLAAYRRSKQGILDAQSLQDVAVIPVIDGDEADWRCRGRILRFGTADCGDDGVFLEGGILTLRSGQQSRTILEESLQFSVPAQLPGRHNQRNLAAAAAAAWLAGADVRQFAAAIRSFRPLPHRLQKIAEHEGRLFYNDSIATTPESAIAALRVFPGRVVLMAGGYDKGQDLTAFAHEIRQRAAAVVLMGQTAEQLRNLLETSEDGSGPTITIAADFADAFSQAVALARRGDIVLLSPGCASYGWFRDYRQRGDQFIAMAQDWQIH